MEDKQQVKIHFEDFSQTEIRLNQNTPYIDGRRE
jgi:hypothetical protein